MEPSARRTVWGEIDGIFVVKVSLLNVADLKGGVSAPKSIFSKGCILLAADQFTVGASLDRVRNYPAADGVAPENNSRLMEILILLLFRVIAAGGAQVMLRWCPWEGH